MSASSADTGAAALQSLLNVRANFKRVKDSDFAAAAIAITARELTEPRQKIAALKTLRATVGEAIFAASLLKVSEHQLRLLARRFDKTLGPDDLASKDAAIAHVSSLLALPQRAEAPAQSTTDDPQPAPTSTNSYFGRKAFRTGD